MTVNKIEVDEGSNVSNMNFIVNGRATNVHSNLGGLKGLEFFHFSGKRVVNLKASFHAAKLQPVDGNWKSKVDQWKSRNRLF